MVTDMEILAPVPAELRIEIAAGHELDGQAAIIQALFGIDLQRLSGEPDILYRDRVLAAFRQCRRIRCHN